MTAAEFKNAIAPFIREYADTLLANGTLPNRTRITVKSQSSSAVTRVLEPIITEFQERARREREIYQ